MSEDVLAMALAEGESPHVQRTRESDLKSLSELAVRHSVKSALAADLEERLSAVKAEITELETKSIPQLMLELRMREFVFDDGSKVQVKKDFSISIKEEMRDAALEWLKDHDHEGIIKAEISVSFGKGEYAEAERLAAEIIKMTNRPVEMSEKIHPMTLKSWAKELREDQDVLEEERIPEGPGDPFTVFDYAKAKLTPPKKKR